MEVFHEAPVVSSFTSLSEHQSHTPASFYSGPPVLYHLSRNARLVISTVELRSPAFVRLLDDQSSILQNGNTEHTEEDGHEDGQQDVHAGQQDGHPDGQQNVHPDGQQDEHEIGGNETTIEGVDIWVTSEYSHIPQRCLYNVNMAQYGILIRFMI